MENKDSEDTLRRLRNSNPTFLVIVGIFSLVIALANVGSNKNTSLAIVFVVLAVLFAWQWWRTTKFIKNAPPELWAQVQSENAAKRKARSSGGAVTVKYSAGLETMNLRGGYGLFATNDCLLLTQGGSRIEIAWTDLESFEAGTEDELRKRLTLTRVAFLGVFALGARKEKKQDFFVTITTTDGVGLFDLIATGKNQQVQAKARSFAVSCNSKIRAAKAV